MGSQTRVLACGVLILAHVLGACTSWRVAPVSPQELVAGEHPSAIQIREQGGAVYVLTNPRLAGDSLTGSVRGVERRIPIASGDRVAVRRFSALKTVGLIVVIPAAVVVAVLVLYCTPDKGPGCVGT